MRRTNSIAVSRVEQDLLDEYCERRWNTTKIPYGLAIQQLIEGSTDIDVQDFMEGNTEDME